MAVNRAQRDLDSREREERPQANYVPPSMLPEPTPEPGYRFHWVATHVLGKADPTNVSKRHREGLVPVKAEDHPEMQLVGNKDGHIEIGGLMLCKMPAEMARARDAYYAKQANAQMDSVDNHFMRNNDPRMPLFRENRSETVRGRFGGDKIDKN